MSNRDRLVARHRCAFGASPPEATGQGSFLRCRQALELLYISKVTLAEIRFGIELVGNAARRAELGDWLAHKVRPISEQRMPVSEEVIFKWPLLVEDGRRTGHTHSQPYLFIAATALHHGMTVVSHDTAEFDRARVPVLNPSL